MLKTIKRFLKNLFSRKKPSNIFRNFWKNFSYLILFFNSLELSKQVSFYQDEMIWRGDSLHGWNFGGHPRLLTKDEINRIKNDNS